MSTLTSDPNNGTPADLTRVCRIPQRGSGVAAFSKAMRALDSDGLKKQGYVWFRVSSPGDDPQHAYLEAWKVKPEMEGTLNRDAAVKVSKGKKP
jgi:hypothetical protein